MEVVVRELRDILGRANRLEAVKNLLLAYTVFKFLRYVFAYIRAKGFRGAFGSLIKAFLQKSILLGRRFIPGADALVGASVEKSVASLQKKILGKVEEKTKQHALPATSVPTATVLAQLERFKGQENPDWKAGKVSGAIYHGGDDVSKLITQAFGMFTITNPLHPELFPGIRQMEAEVISMVLRMYNAPENACGSMTSGGTESLLMAIKTYRDMAKETRGVTEPEIVAPVTIHTAVDKGAAYFGIKLVHVPIDPATGKVDMKKLARCINRNTIMIAGSSPNFPHGIIDPIPEMAALAKKHNLPMHVDACLGGFIVPFAEKAGFALPYFVDFRNEGVTSISCDTHKYGFAPKGSSVIMYRSKEIRDYQYFITTDWPGGVYCSPTIAGSRPGALVAGCWAAMMHFGESGYVESTRKIIGAARKIGAGIQTIPELKLIGNPLVSVIAFESVSPTLKIYGVADLLEKKGWHLNILQNPPAIHIACTYLTIGAADTLVRDVKEVVEVLRKNPQAGNGDTAAIYGTMASVPDRTVIKDVCKGFLDALTMIFGQKINMNLTENDAQQQQPAQDPLDDMAMGMDMALSMETEMELDFGMLGGMAGLPLDMGDMDGEPHSPPANLTFEDTDPTHPNPAHSSARAPQIPLSRVKAIMKEDEDVSMIAADSIIALAFAGELFLEYFAEKTFEATQRDKRRTVAYKDMARTVREVSNLNFLEDLFPPPQMTVKKPRKKKAEIEDKAEDGIDAMEDEDDQNNANDNADDDAEDVAQQGEEADEEVGEEAN
ncbi:hypothetical protein HDU98_011430 [Podochytrium sp. JEL0797]|nr:hypothetical protein HDU98_011430 [Podochytrium sp. JEL0797]